MRFNVEWVGLVWQTDSLVLKRDSSVRCFIGLFIESKQEGTEQAKKPYHATVPLKVPKREIFDRSDFPDFYSYTMKSLRVSDFGVKINKKFQTI